MYLYKKWEFLWESWMGVFYLWNNLYKNYDRFKFRAIRRLAAIQPIRITCCHNQILVVTKKVLLNQKFNFLNCKYVKIFKFLKKKQFQIKNAGEEKSLN